MLAFIADYHTGFSNSHVACSEVLEPFDFWLMVSCSALVVLRMQICLPLSLHTGLDVSSESHRCDLLNIRQSGSRDHVSYLPLTWESFPLYTWKLLISSREPLGISSHTLSQGLDPT